MTSGEASNRASAYFITAYVDVGANEWYEILVDAQTGELLLRFNLYVEAAQGPVYTVSPSAGSRSLLSFVGDTTINTAAGWMGTSFTTGNNVDAYLDADGNDSPDSINRSWWPRHRLGTRGSAGRISI